MLVRLVTSVVLTAGGVSAAYAVPMTPEDKALLQQQCTGDYMAFCGNSPPDDGPETVACFEQNMASLSPGCQGAIWTYKQRNKAKRR
jgi:hypothetical protein